MAEGREELGERDVQGCSETADCHDPDIALATFDASDAVSVEGSPVGQFLLRDFELLSEFPDRIDVSRQDPDLAEAFERREIDAFEYADGHTYPPGLEISP